MVSSNCFVHDIHVVDPLAGIRVYPHPVLGVFMLSALVAEDEVYLRYMAEVVVIGFHTIMSTVT